MSLAELVNMLRVWLSATASWFTKNNAPTRSLRADQLGEYMTISPRSPGLKIRRRGEVITNAVRGAKAGEPTIFVATMNRLEPLALKPSSMVWVTTTEDR